MAHMNFIGGDWVAAEASIANINPSDLSDVVGDYAIASADQVANAVAAASAALPKMADLTILQRSEMLDTVADEIFSRRVELGRLLSREEGKILADGVGEATRSAQIFRYYAGEALRASGERLPSIRPHVDVSVTAEPVGAVAIVTPWNFPLSVPAWKIAPALAFANTVVFKPSELAPASAHALAEIIARVGFPDGAFNLVMGDGETGAALVSHPDIQAISFTGSTPVGRRIAADAVARGVKIQLELGGKNPLIVLDDADLELAVESAVNAAFFQTGQRCTAASRLIVTEGIHDSFVERVEARLRGLRVGHALEPETEIGPVVDRRQLDKVMGYLKLGREESAVLRCGGEPVDAATEGYFLSPALFTETRNDMRLNREEIFGPVAAVIRVGDYEEAIAVANDTDFGLSSALFTRSMAKARDFQRRIKAGLAMVNLPTAGVDHHVPFGGTKASGYGPREQGRAAREFYTQSRTAYLLAQ